MTKSEMKSKAIEALDGSVEIFHDIYVHGNEVDVIGTIGGDAVHYRVYFKDDEVVSIGCK